MIAPYGRLDGEVSAGADWSIEMRIVCIGGGPASLYFAISAKLRDAGHDITVIERDPPGATYGWVSCTGTT